MGFVTSRASREVAALLVLLVATSLVPTPCNGSVDIPDSSTGQFNILKPEAVCETLLESDSSNSVEETSNASSIATSASDLTRGGVRFNSVEDALAPSSTLLQTPNIAESSRAEQLSVVTPVVACEDLLGVDLSHITEDGSAVVTSAIEILHEGVVYCSVEGDLPASTHWQTLLPVATWTQRYMQIGCGGLCGSIRMQVNAAFGSREVSGGEFALAATDMGGGMDGKVFANNPRRRVSFAYSAQHLTALVSKTLIRVYYGQEPRYSYFNGCSDGGREGVMEAIRYPNDFDGILAGAPAMLFQFQNSLHHGWLAVSNTDGPIPDIPPMLHGPPRRGRGRGPPGRGHPGRGPPGHGPPSIVTASKLPLLHAAVLRACDGQDGLVDGLLSEPRLCDFDPRVLQCGAETVLTAVTSIEGQLAALSDQEHCLTTAEVAAILKFYAGPIDPGTGQHLTVGEAQFGSELAWAGVFVPREQGEPVMSAFIALAALRYLVFEPNPSETYTLNDLQFTEETVERLRPRHPLLDATSPDLAAFKAAGGKLILWHGWNDEHISPRTTIAYHEALQRQMGGAEEVAAFERLYMLPGVEHCGHGEGMAAIDLLTPLLEWVERGHAPHEVIGNTEPDRPSWVQAPPTVMRSRPVFPYPSLAKYTGEGDVNNAASFVEGAPLYTNPTREWAGQSFFEPYVPRNE
ncbi:hypothetical protein BBJ28_00019170 [Nothophytophthora sp. Chile5]|nr:hypothetical protein BBJ28_00019170 [Nothophytophthora sp. Chile5]